jgi:hypothetical protein
MMDQFQVFHGLGVKCIGVRDTSVYDPFYGFYSIVAIIKYV